MSVQVAARTQAEKNSIFQSLSLVKQKLDVEWDINFTRALCENILSACYSDKLVPLSGFIEEDV